MKQQKKKQRKLTVLINDNPSVVTLQFVLMKLEAHQKIYTEIV